MCLFWQLGIFLIIPSTLNSFIFTYVVSYGVITSWRGEDDLGAINFDASQISTNGKVKVLKSGVYFIYGKVKRGSLRPYAISEVGQFSANKQYDWLSSIKTPCCFNYFNNIKSNDEKFNRKSVSV